MRHLCLFIIILALLFGCEESSSSNSLLKKKNIVTEFIREISTIENDSNHNPIEAFKILANDIASKKIVFDKENIKAVFTNARDYSSCVIITSNHTILKVIDFDDCQQSGSWKACMPKCQGYIKKGNLNFKNDFMNNLIGKPDKQERIAYLFNPIKQDDILDQVVKDLEIKTPFIHAVSTNQPNKYWTSCNEEFANFKDFFSDYGRKIDSNFFCNNFYHYGDVFDDHPVFADSNNNYLFIVRKWAKWVFYNEYPTRDVLKKIIAENLIPESERMCFVNSFNPTSIPNSPNSNCYLDCFKHLSLKGILDFDQFKLQRNSKMKKMMYEDWELAYQNINIYNDTTNADLFKFIPIPDSTNQNIFDYLSKNYELVGDSVISSENEECFRSSKTEETYAENFVVTHYSYEDLPCEENGMLEITSNSNISFIDFDMKFVKYILYFNGNGRLDYNNQICPPFNWNDERESVGPCGHGGFDFFGGGTSYLLKQDSNSVVFSINDSGGGC